MGKDKKALSLPKSFTRDDLMHVIEQTARIAAKETMDAKEEMDKRNARRSDPGRAARRMLEDYRRLRIAQQEDIEITEAEGLEMRWKYLEDLMGTPDRASVTEATVYAREKKLQYNQYKIQQIESAVSMYGKECQNSGNDEAMRRYRVVCQRFMDEKEWKVEEIAEQEKISDKSVYNDIRVACRAIAVYLAAI